MYGLPPALSLSRVSLTRGPEKQPAILNDKSLKAIAEWQKNNELTIGSARCNSVLM